MAKTFTWRGRSRSTLSDRPTPQMMRDMQWAFERQAARSIAAARKRLAEQEN